jgi:hypothetical protein
MKRSYLVVGITVGAILIATALVFYQRRYSDLLYGSFTNADIALLEDVGLVAHELTDIGIDTYLWRQRDTEYYLDDYQIHPEVLASLHFQSLSGFVLVDYEEIQGKDGYEWVINQNIIPQINAVETLYYKYPNSEVVIQMADLILFKAQHILREYGTLYDENIENTRDYIFMRGSIPLE